MEDPDSRLLAPLPDYFHHPEFREHADMIRRDIYLRNPQVSWSDVCGLSAAKRLVKEAVVYPLKYPQ